jgi:hypothetical protein
MTAKDRALQWANTYFAQWEASTFHDLEAAVKNKRIDDIISLSIDLGTLKEDKAEMIERIQDAKDTIELLDILSLLKGDREDELCFVGYMLNVKSDLMFW